MLLAGLSTGHMIGLGVVGGAFIAFALASSFLAPRRWPDFPGRNGMSVYIIVCVVFFVAMLTAVAVFDVESEAKGAEATAGQEIPVTETEFHIALPAQQTLTAGTYTFVVKNAGHTGHDLVIEGGTASEHTPLLEPGATAKLTVALAKGSYTLYCSVDGHRRSGMVTKISVD